MHKEKLRKLKAKLKELQNNHPSLLNDKYLRMNETLKYKVFDQDYIEHRYKEECVTKAIEYYTTEAKIKEALRLIE